jgi:hypothetical protein
MPRSKVGTVGGETGGLGDGLGVGEAGVGAGADWQPAMIATIASRLIRMQ